MKLTFPDASAGKLTYDGSGGSQTVDAVGTIELTGASGLVLTLGNSAATVLAQLPGDCLTGLFLHVEEGAREQFGRFPSLKRLVLQVGATDATVVAACAALPELNQFGIAGNISAAALVGMGCLTKLDHLILICEGVLDDGLAALAELPALTTLWLMTEAVDVTQLPPLPKLTHLRASGDLDSMNGDVFSRHPALQDLTVKGADGGQLSVLETVELRRAFPELTINGIWHSPRMLEAAVLRANG